MAGSRAGAWVPLPCLTPSASGRASEQAGGQPAWLEKRWSGGGEERRGEGGANDWDWGFWGKGIQAAPPGSPVTANDA